MEILGNIAIDVISCGRHCKDWHVRKFSGSWDTTILVPRFGNMRHYALLMCCRPQRDPVVPTYNDPVQNGRHFGPDHALGREASHVRCTNFNCGHILTMI
jgi:hypothetical protein